MRIIPIYFLKNICLRVHPNRTAKCILVTSLIRYLRGIDTKDIYLERDVFFDNFNTSK